MKILRPEKDKVLFSIIITFTAWAAKLKSIEDLDKEIAFQDEILKALSEETAEQLKPVFSYCRWLLFFIIDCVCNYVCLVSSLIT